MNITFNDITDHIGQPRAKMSGEYVWQCPYCMDNSKDNLHYNEKKNILWCFANEQHSKDLLSEIMKKKYEVKKMTNTEIPKYIRFQEQYVMYQQLCSDLLLGEFNKYWLDEMNNKGMLEEDEYDFYINLDVLDVSEKARAYLKDVRGINTPTIKLTGLGFDFYKGKWVVPIFNMESSIVGFEYRSKNFKDKKIWRESGSPSCLARIYGNGRKAIIHEGFLDSYCSVQMLSNKGVLDEYSIFTTSSGVSSTLKVLNELHFNNYDTIFLLLDNDEAGDKATEEILKKYPFIVDMRDFLKKNDFKDVNEFMLKKGS